MKSLRGDVFMNEPNHQNMVSTRYYFHKKYKKTFETNHKNNRLFYTTFLILAQLKL